MTRIGQGIGQGLAGLILICIAAMAAAHDDGDLGESYHLGRDSLIQTDDVGRNPIVRTQHQEFAFSATGRIDVHDIGGKVEVKSGKGNVVAFDYERKAKTEQDFACQELRYEHDKDSLRIWVERKRDHECRVIHATDALTLTVPRGAEVELEEIGDSVRVTGLDGMLRLSDVGDSAILTDVQQLVAKSIGDTLKLQVSRLGSAGIRIDSVGDSVELSLPEQIDARLEIDSVGDEIRGPGLHLTSMGGDSFETVLGKGGPMIRIDSVGDSVVIKSGPRIERNGSRN